MQHIMIYNVKLHYKWYTVLKYKIYLKYNILYFITLIINTKHKIGSRILHFIIYYSIL